MKINKNDPQLTAYVLNQLSAQQMKVIEAQIQNDPELKAEITRLKYNMTQMKSLKTTEVYRLDPHQRENIFKAAGISQTSVWSKLFKYSSVLVTASLAVYIYTNNSGSFKKAASIRMAKYNTDSAPSEMSAVAIAPSAARTQPKPITEEKKAVPPPIESEDMATVMAEDVAEDDNLLDHLAAKAPPPPKVAKAQLLKDVEPAQEGLRGGFAAGEVGAADMSQNKMQLLDVPKARKKESVAETRADAPAGTAASSFGSGGSAAKPESKVSKQLYDLESKSSQSEIYAKIADPIFMCFDSSLSQYVQYDVAWNLTWSAKLGVVTSFNSEIIDNGTESLKNPRQNFSIELNCAEQVIRTAFKTSIAPSQNEHTFKYRLILKSK